MTETRVGEPVGTIAVEAAPLHGIEISGHEAIIDELPGARGRGRVRRGRHDDPRRGRAGGEGDATGSARWSRSSPSSAIGVETARRRARRPRRAAEGRDAEEPRRPPHRDVRRGRRAWRPRARRRCAGWPAVAISYPGLRRGPRAPAGRRRDARGSSRSTGRRARGSRPSARGVAAALGLHVLDTGAMYRSVTLAVLDAPAPTSRDAAVCGRIARDARIELEDEIVRLDGRDVSAEIRGPEVTAAVSTVSAHPEVRAELVAPAAGLGRGARRRRRRGPRHRDRRVPGRAGEGVPHRERRGAGQPAPARRGRGRARRPTVAEVRESLARRDALDSGRAASPLRAADDALVLDTTGRPVDEVVAEIVERFRAEVPEATMTLLPRCPHDRARRCAASCSGCGSPAPSTSRPSGAYIVAPTHRSNLDTPFAAFVTKRRIRFMAKQELFKHPLGAKFFTALGGVPVERGSPSARAALEGDRRPRSRRASRSRCSPRAPVVTAARSTDLFDGTAYLAVKLGVPIVPVGIGGQRGDPRERQEDPAAAAGRGGGRPADRPADRTRRPRKRSDLAAITAELQVELQRLFDEAMPSPATDPAAHSFRCDSAPGDATHRSGARSRSGGEVGEDGRRVDGAVVGQRAARPAAVRVAAERRAQRARRARAAARAARAGREVLVLVGDVDELDALGRREVLDHLLDQVLRRARAGGDADDRRRRRARRGRAPRGRRCAARSGSRRSSRPWPARPCSTSSRCRSPRPRRPGPRSPRAPPGGSWWRSRGRCGSRSRARGTRRGPGR